MAQTRDVQWSPRPVHLLEPTRDVHICANEQSLTNQERTKLIVSFPKGGALEFYFKGIDPQQPHQTVVDTLRTR